MRVTLNLDTNPGPLSLDDEQLQGLFADLQGNILNGHGRDQAIHLFLRFNRARITDVKTLLAGLAKSGYFTSAKAQLEASRAFKISGEDGGLFAHLALSGNGYRALALTPPQGAALRKRPPTLNLGSPPAPVTFYERDVFEQGMRARNLLLQDPPVGDWEEPFQQDIDALILIADDSNIDLINAEKHLRQLFETGSAAPLATIVNIERGFGLRRKFYDGEANPKFGENVEHFGYVDGRSQPALLNTQLEEDLKRDGNKVWNPVAPPSLVLVKDPNGGEDGYGSFLVFRKLEQDVYGFKQAQRDLANELGCPVALAGALAVGRFEDGTPVALQPGEDSEPAVPNDFDYSGDPGGRKCPFHAHIRKTNPRLESVFAGGPFAQTNEEELGHRIARRGIPYGGGLSDFADLDGLPRRGVGLLFMCYQSDIWEQFEFQQRFWANNNGFVQPALGDPARPAPDFAFGTGIDSIIGQQRPLNVDPITGFARPPLNWSAEWGKPPTLTTQSIAQFVTLKGGEYFFSPSLSSLRALAASSAPVPPPEDVKQPHTDSYSVKLS
ncbi:MAG: hypothetical protein K0R38_6228 [Polyangiaceae bacterium]|nr:hypothetical protein [Polyangiaceae bacterium]